MRCAMVFSLLFIGLSIREGFKLPPLENVHLGVLGTLLTLFAVMDVLELAHTLAR